MLKTRVLTGVILAPIVVALVFLLPPLAFLGVIVAIVLLGAWEWSAFLGLKAWSTRLIYPAIILLLFLLMILTQPTIKFVAMQFKLAFYGWPLALILVMLYPRAKNVWGKSVVLRGFMGIFVLLPLIGSLNFLRHSQEISPHGTWLLMYLLILIWGADIGAYFAGKAFGKHKLAPAVSPGKTWEGCAGALLVTVLVASCGQALHVLPKASLATFILLSLITALYSILGDLFESMLKRNVDLKDSGCLIPGHGGLLDRIDSLTAAAPIFAIGCLLITQTW